MPDQPPYKNSRTFPTMFDAECPACFRTIFAGEPAGYISGHRVAACKDCWERDQ